MSDNGTHITFIDPSNNNAGIRVRKVLINGEEVGVLKYGIVFDSGMEKDGLVKVTLTLLPDSVIFTNSKGEESRINPS